MRTGGRGVTQDAAWRRSFAALSRLMIPGGAGGEALSILLANAWFTEPETRSAIGYPGQEARDNSVGTCEGDRALVVRVSVRGPIWREV